MGLMIKLGTKWLNYGKNGQCEIIVNFYQQFKINKILFLKFDEILLILM